MIIGIDCSRAFASERTGTENYSYHLVTHLVQLPEAKLHTFVLFTRPNALIPEGIQKKNVVIRPIKLRYLWTQLGLARETWKEPMIDVLWVPAHTLPVLRKPGITTVVTIHGLEYKWLREYRNLLQRWYLPLSTIYAAKSADKLIAVSNFTKNQMIKELHTSSKNIKVIQEGVEVNKLTEQQTKVSTDRIFDKYGIQDKKYILFVGTIQPRKNLTALIEAFSIFAKQNPDYRLVIVGGIGWQANSIFAAVQRYDVADKVVFAGRVSDQDLVWFYQSSALYVQPSITEGFGLPVLEAMSYGVPVITSDGGALSEVVGDAGVVVPLNDQIDFSKRLANVIEKVMTDASLRTRMIANGKKRVLAYSWQKAAESTLEELIK